MKIKCCFSTYNAFRTGVAIIPPGNLEEKTACQIGWAVFYLRTYQ